MRPETESGREREEEHSPQCRAAFPAPPSQQDLQEAERFSRKAAQAARDLTRAEAEIELLQNLLREREEQVSAGSPRDHLLLGSISVPKQLNCGRGPLQGF